LAACRLLEQPLEGELDIVAGELLAVVELHALPELERPGELVVRERPGFGELGLDRHCLVEAHELAVGEGGATAPRERGHELRVEAGRLVVLGGDDAAAGLRRLGESAPTEGERAEDGAACLEKVPAARRA